MYEWAEVKEHVTDVVSDGVMGSAVTLAWSKHPIFGLIMSILGVVYVCFRILILHRKAQRIKKQIEAYDALTTSFKGKDHITLEDVEKLTIKD